MKNLPLDKLCIDDYLTLSPLNKRMDYSHTTQWTIPNFEFVGIFTDFIVKFQTIYLYFQVV